MACKIVVTAGKGGVGKTRTVIELATTLTKNGNKVLVVDGDGQTNLTDYISGARVIENSGILECLRDAKPVISVIQHTEYCDVLPGSKAMGNADAYFNNPAADVYLLSDLCEFIEKDYDYIFFDTPPVRNMFTEMAITAADYAILVSDGSKGASRGMQDITDDIKKYQKCRKGQPLSKVKLLGVILNAYETNTVAFDVAEEEITMIDIPKYHEENVGDDIFFCKVRRAIETKDSESLGIPLQKMKKSGHVAVDYRNVVYEILTRVGYEEA